MNIDNRIVTIEITYRELELIYTSLGEILYQGNEVLDFAETPEGAHLKESFNIEEERESGRIMTLLVERLEALL